MTGPHLAIFIGMMIVGLGLSAMFSGMEIGLYTLNRVRVTILAGRHDRRAVRLRRLLHNSNRTLSSLLIGNNIANYMGSFGLAAILDGTGLGPGQAIALNAGVLIPLLFVFGETLPKDLFRTHTDHWSYHTSGFLSASDRLFTITGLAPVVGAFGRLVGRLFGATSDVRTTARQRISQLIKEGVGAGVLTETQITLADRALVLRDRTVRSIMVPWNRVAYLSADADVTLRQEIIRRRNHTRLPVIAAGGEAVGVVSILDALLNADRATRELAEPVTQFPPSTKVHEALRTLRLKRQTMAIIVDPATGRPVGLVTLKDLVEPLTGDLPDW